MTYPIRNRFIAVAAACAAMLTLMSGCNRNRTDIPDLSSLPPWAGTAMADSLYSLVESQDGLVQLTDFLYHDCLFFKADDRLEMTPFAMSVIERYDRFSLLNYARTELQLYERLEGEDFVPRLIADSLTTSRASMKEPQLAYDLVDVVNTIAETGDQDHAVDVFTALMEAPYLTGEPLSRADSLMCDNTYDGWYDKSVHVPDIEEFMQSRIVGEEKALRKDIADRMREKLSGTLTFDQRCICALEYAYDQYSQDDAVDYLGPLLLSGTYSNFLYEVYLAWVASFQMRAFGPSSFTEIPNMYYEFIRNMVMNTILLHVQDNPDDVNAKMMACQLSSFVGIDRFGSMFGNEAMAMLSAFSRGLFIPASVYVKYAEADGD